MEELIPAGERQCANCATPLQGEFCYHCGQSVHSVLKPVHHMLEDTLDIVLHVDGRIVHTLPPLLLRPGFLTLEYFAGRRVRYIAPFRLMFVLCLLAFFVFHSMANHYAPTWNSGHTNAFAKANNAAEVQRQLDLSLAQLTPAEAGSVPTIAGIQPLELAQKKLRKQAAERLQELDGSAAAHPTGDNDDDAAKPSFHTDLHPVQVPWLPHALNERLNHAISQATLNMRDLMAGDSATQQAAVQRMIEGTFGALPAAMFVLVPLFALMLKLFYVFQRQLYMQHLIVALHSHAMIFLSLLLLGLVNLLGGVVIPHAAWVSHPVHWLNWLLLLWVLIYLLIMQKRVYRQGWPMTVVKYLLTGWCYGWLLLYALLGAAAAGVAH